MTLLALLNSTETDHWMDQAQCLRVDPNLMQPERATKADVEYAKGVCAGCPVRLKCREHAKAQRTEEGVLAAYGVHDGEWWGAPPIWQVEKVCENPECGDTFRVDRDTRVGQRSRFCKPGCRVAAHRAAKLLA